MHPRHLSTALLAASLLLPSHMALAMDCYVDPVHTYAWTGTISSGVFMRDNACVSGSTVLATLPKSAAVNVVAFTDGWYYVEYQGGRGWIGSQFVQLTSQNGEGQTYDSYQDFMQANPSRRISAATPSAPAPTPTAPSTSTSDPALAAKMKGYILLDVESHGEAWYVNPTDAKRYYMRDGATAYQMMRSFGQGVYEADYNKMNNGDMNLRSRFIGHIILRAQAHGEAYYIHPKTLSMHYLKDGPAAYEVMRFNSLGISSSNLNKLGTAEVPIK